jgi:SET domain-containing protein
MNQKLEMRHARQYGKGHAGVFAKKKINKDELVFVCGGYVMTLGDERKLPKKLRDVGMQISEELVLTITREADNDGGFNHSCEPNIGIRGQIFFVAMRDIAKGEELVIDYAMVLYRGKSAKPYQLECACGKPSCRGVITDNDWQRPELQARYAGYFSWFLQEKIDRQMSSSKPKGKGGA